MGKCDSRHIGNGEVKNRWQSALGSRCAGLSLEVRSDRGADGCRAGTPGVPRRHASCAARTQAARGIGTHGSYEDPLSLLPPRFLPRREPAFCETLLTCTALLLPCSPCRCWRLAARRSLNHWCPPIPVSRCLKSWGMPPPTWRPRGEWHCCPTVTCSSLIETPPPFQRSILVDSRARWQMSKESFPAEKAGC